MRRSLVLLLSMILLISHICVAETPVGSTKNGSIIGTVRDPAGAVLKGAKVTVEPGSRTTATNARGEFTIADIPPGTYTVTISYIGFGDLVSTVTVSEGKEAPLNAVLAVGKNTQDVVVRAVFDGDAAQINEQRTSENILDVQTAQQIMSIPNANIADAVGRMSGVTLQRNEGEGQYVQIRGTEPRLSNTTIDGVIVPGPDTQVRQVDLSVIPAGLVGSVAINKTLSANQPGDAIGGSVDLRIKQATDLATLDFYGAGGYTPIDNGRKVQTIGATAGKRFGPGGRFGALIGYSYDHNQRGIDDIEPSPDIDSDTGLKTFDSISIRQYLYDRSRYGIAGGLDYKISDTATIYLHGLFSNFRDYGQKYNYDLNNGSAPDYSTSIRRPNEQISDLAFGGNKDFSNRFFTYQVAIAHSRFGGAAGNPGADFAPISTSPLNNLTSCVYSQAATISQYRPQFVGCTTPGMSVYDPSQYSLQDINTTSGDATQLNLQAGSALRILFHVGDHTSAFEFGGLFRNSHKGQDAESPEYDPIDTDAIGMTQFLSNYSNPHFYGGSYEGGPVTNFTSITNYLASNPGQFVLNEGATHLNSDASNYSLIERVSAGYAMNTIDIGRFHLQTGLRIEATQNSSTGYKVVNDANGNYVSTTPVYGSGSYVNPMPSVQLRYTIDKDSDIRAVYARAISRPDPYQLVPYIQEDQSTNPYTITIGNPALVAEHANDYDLLYERYLPSVGLLQGGYFYKAITRPIYPTQEIIPQTGSPYSGPYAGDLLQQYVNGDTAHVQGIELSYQQHLTRLPGLLAGARINANFCYTQSSVQNIANRSDSPPLVGQAPFSWNIEPSYQTRRAVVTVAVSHNGPNIYVYQYMNSGPSPVPYGLTGPFGDNYFYSHTQVDAQIGYYIGKGFTATASGLNMNNEVFGFYNGSQQYLTQREYYKPTYFGGIRWSRTHE